jgi:hypothetical protein
MQPARLSEQPLREMWPHRQETGVMAMQPKLLGFSIRQDQA